MKHYCPSYDWGTCPYSYCRDDGEVECLLKHPEAECDDYAYEMGEDDE